MPTSQDIAKMIDHSLLHPTLTEAELREGCALALKYDAASCCIKPYHTKLTAELLKGSDVKVCAVIGFPHGNSTLEIKVAESKQVMADGATEVDIVINMSKAKEGDWDFVKNEIGTLTQVIHDGGAKVKVIFECDYMGSEEVIKLCEICSDVDADWVKTSTGYNYQTMDDGNLGYFGAGDPELLKLMRKHSKPSVQVKAAGKIRGLKMYIDCLEMGVSRVGTGQTADIVNAARVELDGLEPLSDDKSAGGAY